MALVLVLGVGLFAAEYKGKLKSVDADKNTITLTVTVDDKDKDVTIKVNDDTKYTSDSKKIAKAVSADKLKYAGYQDAGRPIEIKTEGEGDKEVAKEVKVGKKK